MNIKINICYLCGCELTEINKSEGHIIQNALGGHLTSKRILCEKHNAELNKTVDIPFIKIFEPITEKLFFKKDRKNERKGILGTLVDLNIEVIHKDNRYFPLKPFYDSKSCTIYAKDNKTANQYLSKLRKDGVISNESQLVFCYDISGHIITNFNLTNDIFFKGLAKIAANYAAYNEIERIYFNDIIDFRTNSLKSNLNIIPYIPSTFDLEIENRDYYYPIHMLRLKSQDRLLWCFIELYSTFQFYVILDKNYSGLEIDKSYIYSLSHNKQLEINEYLSRTSKLSVNNEMIINYKLMSLGQLQDLYLTNPLLFREYGHLRFKKLEQYIIIKKLIHKKYSI